MRFFALFILLSAWSSCSHLEQKEYLPARLDHFFYDLHIKGYETMSLLIQPLMKKAEHFRRLSKGQGEEKRFEVHQSLRKALLIVLSKPGYSGAEVSSLVQNIQSKTLTSDDFFSILFNITREACSSIKNEDRSPAERATYFYVLENIISETRPYLKKNERAKNIFVYISQAQITIPKSVHSERYMRVLETQTLSPSKMADKILSGQ